MDSKTVEQVQKEIHEWTRDKGFKWSLYVQYIHLVEEIGELGESLTVFQGDRKQGSGEKALADHGNVEEEIGDSLFAIISIANELKLDIGKILDETFVRYDTKMKKKKVHSKN